MVLMKNLLMIFKNKISEEKRLEITKAKRVMLQADYLEFEFLKISINFPLYKSLSK